MPESRLYDVLALFERTSGHEMYSQEGIDQLSEALLSSDPSWSAAYTRGVRQLRRLCRAIKLVPGSCKIPKIVTDVSTAPISQSHFSDIWSGTLDGRKVAIKALRLHEDEREKVKKAYVHELVIWQYLRHPNIVPFVGTSQQFHVSLISEWMIGGTVSAFISNEPNCDRKMLVSDVAHGLSFMHTLDVIHGDLKAGNVLVDNAGRGRITDFGLAILMHATATATVSGLAGSPRWMAPELLDPDQYETELPAIELGQPTKKSDVYALGITAWEIFSEDIPFRNMTDYRVGTAVLRGQRPPRCSEYNARGLSDDIWRTILKCWHSKPSARPSEVHDVFDRLASQLALPASVVIPPSVDSRRSHIILKHQSPVNSVAFLADGRSVVSGAKDGTLRIWDVGTPDRVNYSLTGHHQSVTSVTVSSDGTTIASGSDDRTIWLWDSITHKSCITLRGHTGSVTSVALSLDGCFVASGSDDYTVRIWDRESGTAQHILTGHTHEVTSVAFAPDGTFIASGSSDRTVRIWRVAGDESQHRKISHNTVVTALAVLPDGQTIVSGSWDHVIRLWDVTTGALQHTLTGHTGWVMSIATSPSGRFIASASQDCSVKVWDLNTGAVWRSMGNNKTPAISVVISPNDLSIASAFSDSTVSVWNFITDFV